MRQFINFHCGFFLLVQTVREHKVRVLAKHQPVRAAQISQYARQASLKVLILVSGEQSRDSCSEYETNECQPFLNDYWML